MCSRSTTPLFHRAPSVCGLRDPLHSDADIDALVSALAEVWQSFNLRRAARRRRMG
jgi:hypothetical protein